MADWDIDFPERDEPTHVTTGDECEHSARGENCGRTDCEDCGEDAAAWLVAAATTGVVGIVALAREVLRVAGSGAQYAVTERDLMRLRDRSSPRSCGTRVEWRRAWAWAEGVLDAVSGREQWLGRHDYQHDAGEQAVYMVGRLLVELWHVNEHFTRIEAQAMASADITSAAGESICSPHGTAKALAGAAPGFESRAQHRDRGILTAEPSRPGVTTKAG